MRKWVIIFLKTFIIVLFVSCVDNTELEELSNKNEQLTLKVDSLEKLLGSFEVLTVLNNNSYQVAVGENYSVESMAVLKAGLKLDSLFLNGRYIAETDSIVGIDQGFFGPSISFKVDTAGVYNITAFVSSFAWGNRSVKTKWTVSTK